jgi:monovalent cation:H+ antiporter-2, CPA2 family
MNISDPFLIFTILLALALVGGMIAHRLRQPVMLGYLLVGVVIGPHAFGIINNDEIVESTAAIGAALLMFTLGLEISISQLREVGKVGLWGGIIQIIATSLLGMAAGMLIFRWPFLQAVLFGLIISLSSTAVCLKILMERGELSSMHGRIMIAMLILQDIAVVFMTLAVPMLTSESGNFALDLLIASGKTILIVGSSIILGRWILPWLLGNVGGVRARELFLLTILVLCLGAAIATQIIGFSIVFGAFLIGLVLRETKFIHQALAEITPLRDVFVTLFFVSLGMLLDPKILLSDWESVLLIVAVITLIKLSVVFIIVKLFGFGNRIAFFSGVGLFQVGEFGVILDQAGLNSHIVSSQFHSQIIASIIITILLTPLIIGLISRLYPVLTRKTRSPAIEASQHGSSKSSSPGVVIIAGYGRVGQNISIGMKEAEIPHLIIDIDPERLHEASKDKIQGIYGDATNIRVLSRAGLKKAKALVITYPDPMAVVSTARLALSINPRLEILARVHRNKEVDELKTLGVTELISPEYEASFRFIKRLLNITGVDKDGRKNILASVRDNKEIAEFDPDESV